MPTSNSNFRTRGTERSTIDTVIVLGCYRSGSSCVAGLLSRIGVEFGECLAGHPHNPLGFYEQVTMRRRLIDMFDEPTGKQLESDLGLSQLLNEWRILLHTPSTPVIGLKHPLLCLSGRALNMACGGAEVAIVAVDRQPDEIVASMKRCNWIWTRNANIDEIVLRMCDEREAFLRSRDHLRVSFDQVLDETPTVVAALIEYIDLNVDPAQIRSACDFVHQSFSHRIARDA